MSSERLCGVLGEETLSREEAILHETLLNFLKSAASSHAGLRALASVAAEMTGTLAKPGEEHFEATQAIFVSWYVEDSVAFRDTTPEPVL